MAYCIAFGRRRIGIGTAGCPAAPSPNCACRYSAHGSPVGGSTLSGLTSTSMGCGKEEQSLLGKELLGPALMVRPACEFTGAPNPGPLAGLARQTPQGEHV